MNKKTSTMDIARSPNQAEEKKRALAELLPEVFSEGRVDMQALKRALGEETVIEGGERYRLDWAGKSDAYKVLQMPTTATLRPQRDKSANFDQAQHVFIEGENLEVLKILQKAYFGKVKLIYIDPPYNTGSDSFIYPDRFQESKEEYLKRVNELADDGTLMREGFFRKNSRESGHFHSNWLSMMLPRLYIARNLLREDGVILISINDGEASKLRLMLDELFGEDNFVCQFVWNNEGNIDQQSKIKGVHEYILCYARNLEKLAKPTVIDPNIEETSKLFNDQIENSITKNGPANPPSIVVLPIGFPANFDSGLIEARTDKWPKILDPIEVENGVLVREARVESGWSSRNLLDLFISNGLVPILDSEGKETWFDITKTGAIYGYKKRSENQGHVLSVIRNVGTTKQNSSLLEKWGLKFSYPKPILLIRYFVEIFASETNDIILDYFAGSGTTAQAVLEANSLDRKSRKFIVVQLPEKTNDNGNMTIADLAYKRIVSAIEYIKQNRNSFPYYQNDAVKKFKLAPSNLKNWRGEFMDTPEQLAEQMKMFVKSDKEGADPKDIFYELLLKFGQELTTPVEMIKFEKEQVFSINDREMLFVLENFTESMIEPLLKLKPREVIALDSVFHDSDELKTNFDLQCRDAGVKFTCI